MADEERRRFPRLPLDAEVDYLVLPQAGEKALPEVFTTGSKNIGLGGVCIVTFEKLKAGDHLELKISIPGTERFMVAQGRVAWFDNLRLPGAQTDQAYEAGIEFMNISPADKEAIQAYISSRSSQG